MDMNSTERHDVQAIAKPYLLFLGDITDPTDAKTALGILQWRPEWCAAQRRLAGCVVDLGLPEMTAAEAARTASAAWSSASPGRRSAARTVARRTAAGARCGTRSGRRAAYTARGRSEIAQRAAALGRRLTDVRNPPGSFAPGSGAKRSGRRLLSVGTDCAVGKKYTVLALERELKARGVPAEFRATGQTGVLIAERGVAIDAIVAGLRLRRGRMAVARQRGGPLGPDRRPGLAVSSVLCRRDARSDPWQPARCARGLPRTRPRAHRQPSRLSDSVRGSSASSSTRPQRGSRIPPRA
jgi:hypothetical protein